MSSSRTDTAASGATIGLISVIVIILMVLISGCIPAVLLLQPSEALRFISGSVLGGVVVLGLAWVNRRKNRSADSTKVYATLGWPNAVSLVRGSFLALLAGVTVVAVPDRFGWVPMALYTGAIVADYLDGFFARRTGRLTLLGATLDMEYDAFGVLVASVLVVRLGVAGPWFLLVGAARYLFVGGMYVRRRLGWALSGLTATMSGRVVAGFQMGFLSAALWPVIPIAFRSCAAFVFSAFFFASFLRDWLDVSRYLPYDGKLYPRIATALSRFAGVPLMLAARIGSAVLLVVLSPRLAALPFGISVAFAAMVIVGMAGRLAALVLLLVWIFAAGSESPGTVEYLFEITLLFILILGTGPLSLFSPERRIFER